MVFYVIACSLFSAFQRAPTIRIVKKRIYGRDPLNHRARGLAFGNHVPFAKIETAISAMTANTKAGTQDCLEWVSSLVIIMTARKTMKETIIPSGVMRSAGGT